MLDGRRCGSVAVYGVREMVGGIVRSAENKGVERRLVALKWH